MAIIKKKPGPKGPLVFIEGPIDDRDDFVKEIGQCLGTITFYCEGVTRINSIGVKKWMGYMQSIQTKGVEILYDSISPALVEQFNQVKNFDCKGTVVSLMLPFRCAPCDLNFTTKAITQEIRNTRTIPGAICPKCNKNAVFDELPEEYCTFISAKD